MPSPRYAYSWSIDTAQCFVESLGRAPEFLENVWGIPRASQILKLAKMVQMNQQDWNRAKRWLKRLDRQLLPEDLQLKWADMDPAGRRSHLNSLLLGDIGFADIALRVFEGQVVDIRLPLDTP